MREWDRREFEASSLISPLSAAAAMCLHASQGNAWVALYNGEPAGAIGLAQSSYQPQLASAWAFGTAKFKRVVPALSGLAMQFRRWAMDIGITRVEARCLKGHDLAGKWMAALGATHCCDLPRYGTNGETFELWAWTDADT